MVFKQQHIVFCAICFFLAVIVSLQVKAADGPVFTVQGVEVDVTAENAADAREQAFAQAQYIAFEKLTKRLLSESQMEYFEMPEGSVISALVKDFEVTKEQLSSVRYIATYTFRFQNDAVRNFLGSKGLAYTDVGSKPVLVLPFYQWGARNIIWGENNAWLKAWSKTQFFQGLVPVIIPIGDLQDVSDIDDDEALTYVPDKLEAIKQRYSAGEVIIMLASPSWKNRQAASAGTIPDGLTIMVYRTDRGQPEFASRIVISQNEVLPGEDVFSAGVRLARESLQQAWKSQTLTSASQVNSLKVRVRFGSMQEWVETQQKLRRVQGVNEMKLLSLKQNEANIELQFQGTEDRLRLALAQSDMTLTAPHIDFRSGKNSYQNRYGGYQQRTSPLVYDLYLNKYHMPQGQYR